jgi:transposase
LPFIEEHRRQTIALEQYVYESCLSSNRKKVAKQNGLSQSTVRNIFNRLAQTKVDYNRVLLTRVLGIDEISLKKRHKQFALGALPVSHELSTIKRRLGRFS